MSEFHVFAQTEPLNATMCPESTMDYVQVEVSPTITETMAGTAVLFSGTLRNENSFPIVDGDAWVRIVRKDDEDTNEAAENEKRVVDFLLVSENITIPPRETAPLNFSWQVPTVFHAGEYVAEFFFTTQDRNNLNVATLSNSVAKNATPFTITASDGMTAPAYIDSNTITVNDAPFRQSDPPHVGMDEEVTLYFDLVNPTQSVLFTSVTWTTSKVRDVLDTDIVKQETQGYKLEPYEIRRISHTPPFVSSAVTFVDMVATTKDGKSIFNVQYFREGFSDATIGFSSISAYPLMKGAEYSVFSCIQSINARDEYDSKLILTLKDSKGTVIHRYEDTKDIVKETNFFDTFVPNKSYGTLSLTTTLMHGDQVVDEIITFYDCALIDKSACTLDNFSEMVSVGDFTPQTTSLIYIILLSLVIFGALGALILFRTKQRHRSSIEVTTPEPYDKNI